MVYYRVDAGEREVVHTMFLDHDDEGEYQFRMVSADRGRLVCVYEVSRAEKNPFLLLIYDSSKQESWPRKSLEEGGYWDVVAAKWLERYRRIKAENPELPTPSVFRQ